MRRFYILLALLLTGLAVDAAVWKANENTPATANTTLADDDILTATTTFATTLVKQSKTIADLSFTHYIQVRVNAAPNPSDPGGTDNGGSTSIILNAKQSMTITLYYRRQSTSQEATGGVFASNDGKDVKIYNQSDFSVLPGEMTIYEQTEDFKYGWGTKTLELTAGNTYTIAARGTTIQFFGFKYEKKAMPTYDLGDVNADGDITVVDAMMVVNYILGTNNENFHEEYGDLNGDNNIDVVDVMAIVNIILLGGSGTGGGEEDYGAAPAFPGAEGHGRYVTGGRGGEVIHVTNLNDSGTGSLRAAVKGNNPKIIVFDVGGVIALNSNLTIGQNTTIAGQTAPSPGITIRYYTVQPSSNNIIRFIRVRRGQERDVNDGADAIWQRHVNGVILDHCSFSWSIDEVASFYDNNNFTMQWCTIAESLTNAGHDKGAHGYGGIWGGKLASFHHNLLAHVQNRAPRFNGARYQWAGYTSNSEYSTYQWANAIQAEIVDFRNCVMYNWGNGNGCYGGPGGGYINMVNNYYKAGPATSNKTRVTQVTVGAKGNDTPTSLYGMTSRYYISGNYVTAASSSQRENYDWKGVIYDSGVFDINGEKYCADANHYYGDNVTYQKNSSNVDCVRIKLDAPVVSGKVTTHAAQTAFEKVLNYAGASLHRDEVDSRYATEARNGTATYTGSVTKQKGIIDVVSDVNGYTEANFGTGNRPSGFDSDGDGIPNDWETANGLNPNDASDAKTYTLDSKRKWYSNLEVYLHSLVDSIMQSGNANATESVDEYYPTYTQP